MKLAKLLFETRLAKSISEAKRLIEQGAVEIDGIKITKNIETNIDLKENE